MTQIAIRIQNPDYDPDLTDLHKIVTELCLRSRKNSINIGMIH